ncbi:aminotransferase class I/II-fold pyridoxal phosphate-dependent enzyme [Candidatus Pelagibacter sp.]|jgi:CDP-4-dehydro-6-deoxyglucose reductase, E1|nr:aminotransferase class I/II-fold pyridoxal phosphate-dependent enzyme [Candidatus Pelagibacter sp.]
MKKYSLVQDTISKQEIVSLSKWLLKGKQLTKGKLTLEFEKQFSKYINRKYSLFVNSGSSANLLMLSALIESNKLKNKKAIVAGVSWSTTLSPFMQNNFDIKLCDCSNKDLGIDIANFERLCKNHRPSVAIIVNVLGHSNNIKKIKKLCKKYNIILLEDSCEALGTVLFGKKLGTAGLASSFSFYYGHHISTIEGGMVVTDNYELYNIMLSIRSHGWFRDLNKDFQNKLTKKYKVDEFRNLYTFYYPGYNFRSTDLNAFLGIRQLKKIDKISKVRNDNFYHYKKNLTDFWCQKSLSNFVSSFAFGTLVENRMDVFKYLKKFSIETRPLICGNIGRHPFWIKKYGNQTLKNADIVHDYGLYLPNNFNLKKKDIDYICNKFKEVARPKFFEKTEK